MQTIRFPMPRRPVALIAVAAIHAAGIGALLMIAPTLVDIPKKLIVELIPLPEVMPEPVKKPVTQPPSKKAELPVDRFKPVAPTKPADRTFDTAPDLDPLAGATDGILDGGDIVVIDLPKDPVIIGARLSPRDVQPPYPASMQRQNLEGAVTVRVLVGVDGRPVRVEAVKVDQQAFFDATREWALKRWKFAPATRDGIAVQEWRTMTVRFEMP